MKRKARGSYRVRNRMVTPADWVFDTATVTFVCPRILGRKPQIKSCTGINSRFSFGRQTRKPLFFRFPLGDFLQKKTFLHSFREAPVAQKLTFSIGHLRAFIFIGICIPLFHGYYVQGNTDHVGTITAKKKELPW